MRPSLFVHPLADAERQALTVNLRSPGANVFRSCHILLSFLPSTCPGHTHLSSSGFTANALVGPTSVFSAEKLAAWVCASFACMPKGCLAVPDAAA